jgi:cytidylate kinase
MAVYTKGRSINMVVAISRQTGSGGHTVGKILAQKLGYKFYDKDIVARTASNMDIDDRLVLDSGEYMSDQDYLDLQSGFVPYYKQPDIPYDEIREAQDKVIKSIADNGNCVIVGRGAEEILAGRDDLFSVFIHASMDNRIARVQRHFKIEGHEDKIRRELEEKDNSRENYHRYFFKKEWGRMENYNLSIDTDVFPRDDSAEIIMTALERFKAELDKIK